MTTSGLTVPLYTALSDYSDAAKRSVANDTANAYGVEVIGSATSMYNCHSYAWYGTYTSNTNWIDKIAPFCNDAHCTLLSSPRVGAIAVYIGRDNKPAHSAIVTRVDESGIMCKSKWGANGLFEHELENVPSAYYNNSSSVNCLYYSYTRYHNHTISIDSLITHTLSCNVCGWSMTERHIPNNYTNKCEVCGCTGPFITPVETALGLDGEDKDVDGCVLSVVNIRARDLTFCTDIVEE